MKFNFTFLLFIGVFHFTSAQSLDTLNQHSEPIGGINELAIHYYGIEFNKEQRQLLKKLPLEFIFLINEKGDATLREVNGINNSAILDSLKTHSKHLPKFHPEFQNGMAVPKKAPPPKW